MSPGSSRAPRPQRVAVAMPDETPAGQWLRSIRLSGFTVVILGVLVLAVVVLAPSLRTLVEQQQQIAALQQSVEDQAAAVRDLQGNIDRWSDPAFIEAQARDRLVYVYPGDYTYLVIDDGETMSTDDGAPISAEIQTTRVDWLRSLLGSIVTAGTTNETAEQLDSPSLPSPTLESPVTE